MTPVHHIHVRSKDISGYDDPTRRVKGQMHVNWRPPSRVSKYAVVP